MTEHENIKALANELNVNFITLCGMVAVTSPMKRWSENIAFVKAIVTNLQAGKKVVKESGMIRTANYARIIYNETNNLPDCTVEHMLTFNGFADKTTAFFVNLYQPTNKTMLTVDVWMLRVALQQYQQSTNTFKATKMQIDAIRRAYFNAYNSLNLEKWGVVPHQLQAIIWEKIRTFEVMADWFLDFETQDATMLKRVSN